MSSDRWPDPDSDQPLPNRHLRLSLVFLAVVAAGLLIAAIFDENSGPTIASVGDAAPDFEVRSVNHDAAIALADLINDEGRPIVINLMASWCPPCRDEIPEISAFADSHPDVIVVGIAVEDRFDDFKDFVAEVGPTYPVGFDEGDMRAVYPTFALPATFFLDSNGQVVGFYNGILDQDILEDQVAAIN